MFIFLTGLPLISASVLILFWTLFVLLIAHYFSVYFLAAASGEKYKQTKKKQATVISQETKFNFFSLLLYSPPPAAGVKSVVTCPQSTWQALHFCFGDLINIRADRGRALHVYLTRRLSVP